MSNLNRVYRTLKRLLRFLFENQLITFQQHKQLMSELEAD